MNNRSVLNALIAVLLGSSSFGMAQVNEVWSARFNGTGNLNDAVNAMAVDDSGYVYVTGSAVNIPPAGVDFCTIKYNLSGDTVWVRMYNGTGDNADIGRSIAVDKMGNVYVTGDSRSGSSFGTEDYVTIKYSPTGDSLWGRRYDGLGGKSDFPTRIGLDDSGNVYVTGTSIGSANAMDITTIKYSTAGEEQWVKRWSGDATFAFSSGATDMAVTDSGNVYITGHVNNQTTFWDFATLKYDRSGTMVWHAYYAGPLDNVTEESSALTIDADENVYVAGTNSKSQPVAIKYNSAGIEQWTTVPDTNVLSPKSIAVDSTGNVYIGCDHFKTIKCNSTGDTLWSRRLGENNFNFTVASLAVNADGEIYAAGRNGRTGSTDYDFLLVKYHPNGDTLWTASYNDPVSGSDVPSVLKLGNDGSIYVAGYSADNVTKNDMYVIKYSEIQVTGVRDVETAPKIFSLLQNYPNPFNPATTIRFTIPVDGMTTLKIYNTLGQEVATLVNEPLKAGEFHQATFDASRLASGIYFARLQSGENAQLMKMLLLK